MTTRRALRAIFITLLLVALVLQCAGYAQEGEDAAMKQKAIASIRYANSTILFVDMEIARAEYRHEVLIRVVPTLAEARRFYARAVMLFENGYYDEAYGNSSEAFHLAKDAFSKIPITKTEEINRMEAELLLEGVNASIFFVDVKIAVAEGEKIKVTSAVPKLAEARQLLKRASETFDKGDYAESTRLSVSANTLTQEAVLSIGKDDVDVSRIIAALASLLSFCLLLLLYSRRRINITVIKTPRFDQSSLGTLNQPRLPAISVGLECVPKKWEKRTEESAQSMPGQENAQGKS